jgi:hypothetical protein
MSFKYQLHPLGLSDLFDFAFRLYKAHFFAFVGISAIASIPTAFVQAIFVSKFGVNVFTILVPNLLTLHFASRAITNVVVYGRIRQPPSDIVVYISAFRRYVVFLLADIFKCLVMMIPVFPIGMLILRAIIDADTNNPDSLLPSIGFISLILSVFYLSICFSLNTQAIILENYGPLTSLWRSWRLTTGGFGRTLITILLTIIICLITQAPALLGHLTLHLSNWGAMVIAQCGLIVTIPLQLTLNTLLYYDLCIRKERFGVELDAMDRHPEKRVEVHALIYPPPWEEQV